MVKRIIENQKQLMLLDSGWVKKVLHILVIKNLYEVN